MPPLSAKRKEQLANEIRSIRKKPGNLVCVDCPSRNTSYVCTKFNTFVCTNCSGLYRKYTFRVKSVSVAEFTEDEVERLRNGGNKVCNNLYMAKWRKRDVLPKGDDLKVLDAFIERKYVKKEWFSEKGKKSEKKKKKKRKKKIVEESESSDEEDKTASEEVEKEKKKKKKDRDKTPAPVAKKKSSEPDQLLDLDTMFADGPPQPITNAPQQSNNDFGGDDWGFGDNSSAPTTQPSSGRPRQDTWDPFGEKVEQQPPPQQAPPADDFFGGWGNPGPGAAAPQQQPPQEEVRAVDPTPPKKKEPFVDPFSSLLGSSDPPPAAPTSQPAGPGGMYQNNQNGLPNNQGGAQMNPYGGQNAYGQHQSPMMGGYGRGAPVGNPYAPQGVQQNPYGGNPYAPAPANNPYASGGNPYNPGQPSNPYAPAQPQMGGINYGMGTLDIGPPVSGGVSADNPFA